MSLPNTNELQTWDVDRVAQWLTQVGLSDCIETFRNRDIDGKTLSKYNEGKCMSLMGISMKMKRELWRHVNIYIEENPPLGSRPQSKIIPKGVQKFFGGTSVTKVSKTTEPPIDYTINNTDDSDGEAWPDDEFDSDPEDFDAHPNHTSLSYKTPSEPAHNADDFYELPWDDPLAQKNLHETLRQLSDESHQSSSGCSSLPPCSSNQSEPYERQVSQELGSYSDEGGFSYDRRISDVYGSESDLYLPEHDQEPHGGDNGDSTDEEYEQPSSSHPSPSKFAAIGLSPIHKPTKSRVPDPEPEPADELYEITDFDSDPKINQFTKSSTLPSSVPPAPAPIKSRTLPQAPSPIKKDVETPMAGSSISALKAKLEGLSLNQGPKRTVPTPPDSRSNSLSSSSSIPGSPQFPRSPKLGTLPPPFRSTANREPRTSVTSLSSNSSDSGSGVVGPPPLPPRIPCPLPPTVTPPPVNPPMSSRPEPTGQEDKPASRRGSMPLPTPPTIDKRPMPPVPSDETNQEALDGLYGYPWFHGSVSRDYANRKLPLLPEDGTFLIRKSSHGPHQPYSLDLWFESAIKRLPIRLRDDGKYALGKEKDGEQSFAGVADLVAYHKDYPIFLVGYAGAEVTLKRTPPK